MLSTNFWKQEVCWHHPSMFCLIASRRLSHQFPLEVKVKRSNPGYLLKYFLLYFFVFMLFFVVILVLFFDVVFVFFFVITGFFLFLQFATKAQTFFFINLPTLFSLRWSIPTENWLWVNSVQTNTYLINMAIGVVEISNEGYKIRKKID